MKADYHRGTILLTNGIHKNIHLLERPCHHISSVSVIEPSKSTVSLLTSAGSSSGSTIVGYINGSQIKGSNNMSVHDDLRITHKVNLAAAFHDHISCTKLPSQISKNGGDINSLIGASLNNNGSCIDTNNSLFGAAAGSSNEDKIQIKNLKDMILMQLDLIQHQQEQLLKKERQLQGLKHDRESLCLKIDKMENRINFLTRKLLEANSSETASPGIVDNNTHPGSINELNAQSSDSEVMISCMSDTNDVSNMFTNVYSTSSPPSTSNPAAVPRTKSDQSKLAASSNKSQLVSCGTQTTSTGDIVEASEKSKPKSTVNSVEKKVKVDAIKSEIKKEEVNTPEKKNNSKETKKSNKRKRPPSSTTTTTTSSSIPLVTAITTTQSKNVSAQVNKDDLPVSTDKSTNSESSNEEITASQSITCSKKRRRTVSKSGSSTPVAPTTTPAPAPAPAPIDQQQPVNNVNCKSSTNVNVLETDEPYDLYNCRQEKSVIERLEASHRYSPISINQIEVPSWRIINVPDSSSTDGIESLDDDTYLKRHQKLENDERRRKRWDIQRLREQKLNEKLRSGRYYYSAVNFDKPTCSMGQSKQIAVDLISFFQDPKEVQFIEVSDKIPVMAFGLPIPNLPPKHFTLPWLKSSCQP